MTAVHQGCVGQQDATSPASQVGMEGEARNETLIERLTAFDGGHQRDAYALIDEAAARIRDLEAENARLRSAPIPAVQGAVAWRYRQIPVTPRGWTYCSKLAADDYARFPDRYEIQALGVLAAPQSEPLPGGVGEREKVARIIDPLVYELTDALNNAEGEPEQLRKDATAHRDERLAKVLDKADRILAALSGKEQG